MTDKAMPAAGKTIRPAKEISADVMDKFSPRLSKAIKAGSGNLTIDCSRIKRIDAVGAAALLQALHACCEAGGRLTLTHLKENISYIFSILGLDCVFDLKP